MENKKSSTKTFLIIGVFLIALALAGVYTFYHFQNNGSITASNTTNENISANNIQTGPGLPQRLSIPAIQVDASVEELGLAPDGSVDVPKGPYTVGWYKLGPRPGTQGSAVIVGHYGPWKDGAHSVFDNLYKLKPGDTVSVKDDKGTTTTFVVKESRTYDPSAIAPEVFNQGNGNHLNLITCNGDWLANQKTYTKRLVVFTDQVP